MPSPAYNSLLKLVSVYVDAKKATEVLARQMTACHLNADTMSSADIKNFASRFATAYSLYISDSSKRDEFKSKIAAL
jgi:hypothetical protein